MKQPSPQTRLLASAPVFFGAWGLGILSVVQLSQDGQSWPLALISGGVIAGIMKADAQVKAYQTWQRDWDAMAGTSPVRRKNPPILASLAALVITLTLLSLLTYARQHGGSQAVVGVFLILGAPLMALAGIVQLCRRVRRGRATRAAAATPVTVAVTLMLLPLPSVREAYLGLPDHCRAIMKPPP